MICEKDIDCVQWNYIDEQLIFYYFIIEVVLGYLLQFCMLQWWFFFDLQAGQEWVCSFIFEME